MVDFHERDRRRDTEFGADRSETEGDESGGAPSSESNDGDGSHDRADHVDHSHTGAGPLGIAIVTVSSSRSRPEDASGDAIAAAVEDEGHRVAARELVGDDHDAIQGTVDALIDRETVDLVVTTGGTGVTPDDVTIEAIRPLFGKELPGFGELFRQRSLEEVGTRVVATRATAGIADRVPVFCLPGSEGAASLGIESIILPEANHIVGLVDRE